MGWPLHLRLREGDAEGRLIVWHSMPAGAAKPSPLLVELVMLAA